MLKKFLLTVVVSVFLSNHFVFSQISSFPYNEGFESTFTTGTNVNFIPSWNGNEVQTSSRIFRDGVNMRTGVGSLGVIPISSFNGTIIIDLNFSSLTNCVADFWARSVQNSTGSKPAIVNFSVSTDGGTIYSTPTQIGNDATFPNATTPYANYMFNFPASSFTQSTVKLKIVVSPGTTGSGTTAEFAMDDFSITGTPFVDLTPPTVSSINVINANQLDVIFNEPVDQTTAETVSNYSVNNGIGSPNAASLTSSNAVRLTFTASFSNGVTNTLSVLNVKDLNNNAITIASTGQFTYFLSVGATPFDIVINEIMADPDPQQGLPNYEYLELFNRTNSSINLNNWTIKVSTGSPKIFGNVSMPPKGYLLLCTSTAATELQIYGATTPIFTSSTTLTNGGTTIILADNTGITIDSLNYSDTWYLDSQKKDGGWSLERIDPDYFCPNSLNWIASADPSGGTPGKVNSVKNVFVDTKPARLSRAYVSGVNSVIAVFNKPMNISQIIIPSNYIIDHSVGNPLSVNLISSTQVELVLPVVIDSALIYTLTANSTIKDCPGNLITKTSTRFAIPVSAAESDIIFNEVLYRPTDTGSEFFEVYNRSDKVLDLGQLRLSEVKYADSLISNIQISATPFLIFSGDYVVLTKNADAVQNSYMTPNPDGFINVTSFPSLVDGGAEFAIFITPTLRIDQFRYSSSFQLPLLNDDKGVSLERISFNHATQDSTNWHSAAETVGFATPAYENSQHTEVIDDGGDVSVTPEIFSPDNDGNDDIINIRYHFDSPGYTANLKIFDSKGRLMIHLIKNELIGIDGSFIWDGITNNSDKAKVGIYVAYLEVFNTEGKIRKFKKPFVLAAKL